jgi:chromosome segregation ATPase
LRPQVTTHKETGSTSVEQQANPENRRRPLGPRLSHEDQNTDPAESTSYLEESETMSPIKKKPMKPVSSDLPQIDLNDFKWQLEIKRLQTSETDLEKKVSKLDGDLNSLLAERSDLNGKISLLRSNNRRLSDKSASLENDKGRLEENSRKLLSERNELRDELNARVSLYEEQTGVLKKRQQAAARIAEEKITQLVSDKARLQNDIRQNELEQASQISEFHDKLATVRAERDTLWRENKNFINDHKREIENLEEINKSKERRCEALMAEEQKLRNEIQSLYTEQNRLNMALTDLQYRSKTERNRLETLKERQSYQIEKLTETISIAENQIEALNEALHKSQNESEFHRSDAEQLRAYMAKAETQQGPLRDEDFYIQNFGELKTEVENWMARNSRNNAGQSLSASQLEFILQSLADLGQHGQKASDYLRLNQRAQTWYSTPRWRIPLVRHIVAAFIFAHIFQPFVVGLPPASSEILEWIDHDLVSQGSHLGKGY